MKNKEWIRGMADAELAEFLLEFSDLDDRVNFCRELPECVEDLDAGREIPPRSVPGLHDALAGGRTCRR